MNIIQAIKSGKPFRRKILSYGNGEPSLWLTVESIKEMRYRFSIHSVISEDWEINIEEEQKLELSWEQIRNAVGESVAGAFDVYVSLDSLKKKLGFE